MDFHKLLRDFFFLFSLCAFRRRFLIAVISIVCTFFFYYLFIFQSYDLSSIFSTRGPRPVEVGLSNLPALVGYDNRSPSSSDAEDVIYILAWTKRFHAIWPQEYIRDCARIPAARCLISSSRDLLNRSVALIFHARDLLLFSDIPKVKYRHQKYIFYNHESPLLTRVPMRGAAQKFFDWTMTYRRDSTIYCPYAYFEFLNHTSAYADARVPETLDLRLESDLEKRPKLVAWFVSNCETHSKRERYVYELQRHINVDVYGDCGSFRCPKGERRKCLDMLAKNYKFYIGFENAVCRDYVSEKFASRLALNLVVIVLRRSDHEYLVPTLPSYVYDEFLSSNNGSLKTDRWNHLRLAHKRSWWFFIAADDFGGPKDLADYLYFLHNNPREYLRYFEWQKYWRILEKGDQHCSCELCSRLYEERRCLRDAAKGKGAGVSASTIALDIHKWWNVDACEPNFATTLL